MPLPALGIIAQFVVANGGRAAIRKYGKKAVEKATKQIKARQKTIDKRVADKKASDKMFGKKKGETYPSKFSAKQRARGAEVQRTKALKRRVQTVSSKIRSRRNKTSSGAQLGDDIGNQMARGPVDRKKKVTGGSIRTKLSSGGPAAKPN